MSATGKSLLGLWLYKKTDGDTWTMKEAETKPILPKKEGLRTSTNSMVFSLKHGMGGLSEALSVVQDHGINVVYIESRKSQRRNSDFDIYMDVECGEKAMQSLATDLSKSLEATQLQSFDAGGELPKRSMSVQSSFDFEDIPWFPRKISDLDRAQKTLMYGSDLDADHPGFKDSVYRERRKHFSEIAMKYRHGQTIPRVEYTEEETRTWGVVFEQLSALYETYACQEYLENFHHLKRYWGYRRDNIPQLAELDTYLRQKTGFQLRPVAGYLSPRDFLAALAFRVFSCTQYIRHSSDPLYTPEPFQDPIHPMLEPWVPSLLVSELPSHRFRDCCHELLGHVPLLANPSFAQFSQELGLASLGASEEEISKLATCYFFTVEFGLCRENNQLRVYGAGLLSSIAELKHALSSAADVRRFDPEVTCSEECIITAFQNVYFYTDSFEEAKDKMRDFAATIHRPFGVRYNPYTHSVDVLSSTQKVAALVSELRGDLCIVSNALRKIQENDEDADVEGITSLLSAALPTDPARTPNASPPSGATPDLSPNHTPCRAASPNHPQGRTASANQMPQPTATANQSLQRDVSPNQTTAVAASTTQVPRKE